MTLLVSRRVLILMICVVSNFGTFPSIAAMQTTASIESRILQEAPTNLIFRVEKLRDQDQIQLLSNKSIQLDDRSYYPRKYNQESLPSARIFGMQPTPKQTHYVLHSGAELHSAVVTYSIDEGKTYSTNPIIPVRNSHEKVEYEKEVGALYTNILWEFPELVLPKFPID